jgi:hypothetical protein
VQHQRTAEETTAVPLITSLHRVGNTAMPFSHASMVLGEIPVSDTWARTVEQYGNVAKVVILREAVPRDIATGYADVAQGVLGQDLPAWLGMLLAGRLHAGTRDVPVTSGDDPMSIGIDPAAPATFPEWAHQVITPDRSG